MQFQPDAAILSVTAVDEQFVASHLRKALIQGVEPSPGYREVVQSVISRARVNGKMPAVMIERRLQPYFDRTLQMVIPKVRTAVRAARSSTDSHISSRASGFFRLGVSRSQQIAWDGPKAAGLQVIDLSPAFDSVTDRSSLILAKWDDHTTALGHRLLAEELYKDLVPVLFGSPSIQRTSLLQKP